MYHLISSSDSMAYVRYVLLQHFAVSICFKVFQDMHCIEYHREKLLPLNPKTSVFTVTSAVNCFKDIFRSLPISPVQV
jgi:hypothetical protein